MNAERVDGRSQTDAEGGEQLMRNEMIDAERVDTISSKSITVTDLLFWNSKKL